MTTWGLGTAHRNEKPGAHGHLEVENRYETDSQWTHVVRAKHLVPSAALAENTQKNTFLAPKAIGFSPDNHAGCACMTIGVARPGD